VPPAPDPSGSTGVSEAAPRRRPLHALLLVSAACLAVQVVLTNYGEGNGGAAGGWFAIGCLLLVLVYRASSRVARGLIVVTALVGAVLHGIAAVDNPPSVLVALAFLGQAVPLSTGPVREHVQSRV